MVARSLRAPLPWNWLPLAVLVARLPLISCLEHIRTKELSNTPDTILTGQSTKTEDHINTSSTITITHPTLTFEELYTVERTTANYPSRSKDVPAGVPDRGVANRIRGQKSMRLGLLLGLTGLFIAVFYIRMYDAIPEWVHRSLAQQDYMVDENSSPEELLASIILVRLFLSFLLIISGAFVGIHSFIARRQSWKAQGDKKVYATSMKHQHSRERLAVSERNSPKKRRVKNRTSKKTQEEQHVPWSDEEQNVEEETEEEHPRE